MIYYISNTGLDTNDGFSQESPWLTIDKVNSTSLVAGDSVLFKRGDSFYGTLMVDSGTSGNPIYYGAYGTGNKPILHNSVTLNNTSDWTEESPNVWKTTATITFDVGNIVLNNEQSVGVKKWNKIDLISQGQYWYDEANALLYLYSTSNPASFYTEIRACLNYPIVNISSGVNVVLDNLDVRYGAANGIHGTYCNGITISNCDVSWIGGGKLSGTTRYGNGIQFYYSAQNILVKNCRIWEIYDTGITNQYQLTTGTIIHSNITYRNNIIWNCEWSYEYYNRSTAGSTSNVSFINNTCYNAGGSWAHAQRPDPSGFHLRLAGTPTNTTNFIIKNNIFHTATSAIHRNWDTSGKYTIDYNCLFQPSGNIGYIGSTYYATFSGYKTATGWDGNSINSNPNFTNELIEDFSLLLDSPCVNAGYGSTYQGALPYSESNPSGKRTVLIAPNNKYYKNMITGKFLLI